MLARRSYELMAPLHPSAWLVPPPASTDAAHWEWPTGRSRGGEGQTAATVLLQWGRSLFHCFFSLWVKASCTYRSTARLLQSMSVQGGGIALLPWLAGKLRQGALPTICPRRGWGNQ